MTTSVRPPAPLDEAALDRALARADAYRLLAGLFRDPDDPDLQGPDADPGEGALAMLRSALDVLEAHGGARAWAALAPIADRQHRAVEHRAVFGHVVAHGCPPYETEYGRRHVFGQSQDLGDIRGFYEAFGVRPRRGGERPDHVAVELEFLALLALKEAVALATGEAGRVDVCRDAARRFLADHAGRWLPALAGRIARRAPDTGYAALAALASDLAADHARELGAAPLVLDPDDVVPITEEPDGFTFACGIDAEGGDLAPPGA